LLTFADGVASGLNPFDDHRNGPVENGDPTVWNVGRAFGSGAGVVGDLALMMHGSQMIGGGGAAAVVPQYTAVGVVGAVIGAGEVAAGLWMLPRHAQVFGASINQMSRPPATGGARQGLRAESGLLGSKKHGVRWTEGPARARNTGIPQGQFGSEADVAFAVEQAQGLAPGEHAIFNLPEGSTSVVHMPDGSTRPATRVWVRHNSNGVTVHAYPME
jgi:hypothetical protein